MSEYTETPWRVQHPHDGERGREITDNSGLHQVCQDITEANARRIVACVNACEGLDTGDLESTGLVSAVGYQLIELTKQRDALLAETRLDEQAEEIERLRNTLLEVTTRHLTESWKRRASDKELEQYLSAGIAQLEAERDNLRAELAAPAQDVEGVVEALRAEFPLLDDEGLDQEKHHCEWAMQQDRKRLHKLLAALTQAAVRLKE